MKSFRLYSSQKRHQKCQISPGCVGLRVTEGKSVYSTTAVVNQYSDTSEESRSVLYCKGGWAGWHHNRERYFTNQNEALFKVI